MQERKVLPQISILSRQNRSFLYFTSPSSYLSTIYNRWGSHKSIRELNLDKHKLNKANCLDQLPNNFQNLQFYLFWKMQITRRNSRISASIPPCSPIYFDLAFDRLVVCLFDPFSCFFNHYFSSLFANKMSFDKSKFKIFYSTA